MNYRGVIIEESLASKDILGKLTVLSTKVERVTAKHSTPWLDQWTLHTVEVPEARAENIAEKLSKDLDYSHGTSWYADFKNKIQHYIIFKDKIFKIPRQDENAYRLAREYGISLGIPEYQVDFSPEIK